MTEREIGLMLRGLREHRAMTVIDLAKKSCVKQSTILRLENEGIHGFKIFEKLVDAMDYDLEIRVLPKEVKEVANGKSSND